MGAALLPRWDDQTLRVKASKLLGSQSLARYVGWRGDRLALTHSCCYSCTAELITAALSQSNGIIVCWEFTPMRFMWAGVVTGGR